MNPSYHSDELIFQIRSPNACLLPIQKIPEDQILHDSPTNGSCLGYNSHKGKGKMRKQLPAREKEDIGKIEDENKKWMRKETEKLRRQEMATLCASLRSLLPLEYIKGKRSTSDHLYETLNYIKHLKNKVKQLEDKRDELMKLSNLSFVNSGNENSTTHLPTCVIVLPCLDGVQIMCSYSLKQHAFPLSSLLDILRREGLNVVSCTSTKSNDHQRLIHIIQSEISDMARTDFSELRRKISEGISSSSSILIKFCVLAN
ncbi:hypothetical protein L6164_008281 [Bauhinia variegata]|uniref:Uncharacterized protein n=1 Tax=Bauhinia variegata TaxID=167791 RepID=A0ACB9PHP1_BAUVA|nr:hypothetical protein L6164_008281 [Bauhinia variegata]